MSQNPSNLLWENVKELLMQHDCVIVPGFGGFVCNREPARIDQVSHVITPPARKVVFNQNLKSNDGLLAGHLAKKEQLTYSQALGTIESIVASVMEVLQEKKSLSIELFGNFRLNADANYVFLPDKRNNYLSSSFGLGLIQAQPVASRTLKNKGPRVFRDIKNTRDMSKKRNPWPSILVGVLVALLSVNGYIFMSEHSIRDLQIGGGNTTASIASWFDSLFHQQQVEQPVITQTDTVIPPAPAEPDPTLVSAAETVQPSTVTPDTTVQNTLDAYAGLHAFAVHFGQARGAVYFPQQPMPVAEDETIAQPSSETPTNIEPAPVPDHLNTQGISQGYYVIGGVFCKERNAKRFLQSLAEAGFSDAELLLNPDIRCKRVSYKRFNTRKEAEQLCAQIKSGSNPAAWILSAK